MTLPAFLARTLAGCAAVLLLPAALAADPPAPCFVHRDGGLRCPQGSVRCMPDALGHWFCAPRDGGVEVNNFGQPLCGPGYCTRDWKGDVFCAATPRGASDKNLHGQPVCTGGCVPGQAALCTAAKP